MCSENTQRAADRDPDVLPDFIVSRNGPYSIRIDRKPINVMGEQAVAVIVRDEHGEGEAAFSSSADVRYFARHLLRMADLVDEANDGQ